MNSESLTLNVTRLADMVGKEEPRDPVLARFVYERLQAKVDRGTSQVEIAKRTGASRATLSNILTGRGAYGVGRRVAEQLTRILGYRDYRALVHAAHAADHGAPADEGARFPALAAVLVAEPDRWSGAAQAATRARALELDTDEDPGEAWWSAQLDRDEQAIRLASLPLPTRVANSHKGDRESQAKRR